MPHHLPPAADDSHTTAINRKRDLHSVSASSDLHLCEWILMQNIVRKENNNGFEALLYCKHHMATNLFFGFGCGIDETTITTHD
jgi:hypothetical protein